VLDNTAAGITVEIQPRLTSARAVVRDAYRVKTNHGKITNTSLFTGKRNLGAQKKKNTDDDLVRMVSYRPLALIGFKVEKMTHL
jgi:hypothetical protein